MASLGADFVSEFVGTAILILFGNGVNATVLLAKSKGFNGGWLLISFGWGLGVFAGVSVSYTSGAYLNPAVTVAELIAGKMSTGVVGALVYIVAEILGGVLGAVLTWAAFKKQFDATEDPVSILGVFSTSAEVPNRFWNMVTEVIATFALVYVVLAFSNGGTPASLGGLPVALLVVGIGASLGGPTGYAINPARDLGPRIAHSLLPIAHKGSSEWPYAWIPILGPVIGGAIAGAVSYVLLPIVHP